MIAIARTERTVTLSEIPFAITGLLLRNARREARRERWHRLFSRSTSSTHSARIGSETIESNLPLP